MISPTGRAAQRFDIDASGNALRDALTAAERMISPAVLSGSRPAAGFKPPRESHSEREFFIDNLLVRIHSIIVMIR